MRVLDPGHAYALPYLDQREGSSSEGVLTFVKRVGPGYPGNSFGHAGTTIQEVLRALLERLQYLDSQIPCSQNEIAQAHLRGALLQMEIRAAIRHGRDWLPLTRLARIEKEPTCPKCFHIGCEGACHP